MPNFPGATKQGRAWTSPSTISTAAGPGQALCRLFALDPTSEPQLQRIRRSPFLPSTPRRRPPLQGLERSVHWVSQSEKQAGPARNHGGILGVEQSQGSELLDHAHPLPLRAWGRSAPRILELAHDRGGWRFSDLGFGILEE